MGAVKKDMIVVTLIEEITLNGTQCKSFHVSNQKVLLLLLLYYKKQVRLLM